MSWLRNPHVKLVCVITGDRFRRLRLDYGAETAAAGGRTGVPGGHVCHRRARLHLLSTVAPRDAAPAARDGAQGSYAAAVAGQRPHCEARQQRRVEPRRRATALDVDSRCRSAGSATETSVATQTPPERPQRVGNFSFIRSFIHIRLIDKLT